MNKAYPEKKIEKEGQLSFSEQGHNEYKFKNNKQSVEEILFQGAVKTTIQAF